MENDVVHVPRFWGYEHGVRLEHTGIPQSIHVSFSGTLMDELEQPRATDAVLKSLRETGGALLSLGTGCGKTTCACYIISQIKLKTVVLVHKDVLKTQWADRIAQFLPGARVSFVQGDSADMSGDIVIAMLQTLVSPGREYDWSEFGLVVVDECHHIAAETFNTAMRTLTCPYSLGLSATPNRKDGLTKVITWFLGPIAFQSRRKDMSNVSVEYVRYWCERYKGPPPLMRSGTLNFTQMITDLTDDTQRTRLIVEYVTRIREDPARIVLVLSHRRDHCTELASKIEGAVAFLGTPKRKTKNTDHQTAPVVCATYSIASEGYDDPRLNTLVLATPVSDVTQAMGRITRGVSSMPPVIIDIMDDYGVFYAQAAKRKSEYKSAGFSTKSQFEKKYPKCIIID
jgi:superfamily II DNA or RNA helicase